MADNKKTKTHVKFEIQMKNASLSSWTSLIPSYSGLKGDLGRIAIIGGSPEYTGAPYFAAISALRTGSDLVYILTQQEAAVPIKSYSPDLIVMPLLNQEGENWMTRIYQSIGRCQSWVIGPGLGRQALYLDVLLYL